MHQTPCVPVRTPCELSTGLAACPSVTCWLPPYLGLAQEIHGLQVLQVPPVGPEDLAPWDTPRLQGNLFLGESAHADPRRTRPTPAEARAPQQKGSQLPPSSQRPRKALAQLPHLGTRATSLQKFLYLRELVLGVYHM